MHGLPVNGKSWLSTIHSNCNKPFWSYSELGEMQGINYTTRCLKHFIFSHNGRFNHRETTLANTFEWSEDKAK